MVKQIPPPPMIKVESQELGQLLWHAVIEGGDGREAVLAPRPPAAAAAAASNPARHVNCSRNKRSQSKIQRQEKVTESPSSSLAERVGRTKAERGQAERGQAERGRPAPSLRRPRGGADFGRETEGSLLPSNSARVETGIPRGSAALESEQAGCGRIRSVSSPVPTVTQQGRERDGAAPPHLPAAPSNGGGDAAQPGCHGNDNPESSSATDGEMATLQQKFQQLFFFNSLQETKDKKKSKSKSVHIVTDEDAAGPSHPAEETEPEIITRSLSLGELCDLLKEFTCQMNKSLLTWLLRI
nr:uncharacterized protein LOC121468360 [Taeniopygia guttata]